MKIVTPDLLYDAIQNDFTWRDKELKLIYQIIPKDKNEKQSAFIRAAIPILYAHWEGFIKKSSEFYLEYVAYYSSKYLKYNQLLPQFITLSLNSALNKTEVKNIIDKTEIIKYLLSNLNSTPIIPTKNIIQTKSNLTYFVFKEIMFILNIDDAKFIKHQALIDDLVENRNNIAHGNQNHKLIDFNTYENTYNDILSLMRLFKTEVENSALLQGFKL